VRAPRLLAIAFASLLALGCPKKDDVIVQTSAGKALGPEQIDREPLALLPSGAVAVSVLDAKQLFASQFGPKLLTLTQSLVPVPASANFDPARDLERLVVAAYSMQGADAVGVATGRFDKAAIERSADGVQQTPLGTPVVRSSYADRELFTSRNIGFVVLTERTVLIGTETGIRRALDRIKEGRVRKTVAPWMGKLLDEPNAPIATGFDLRAQPITDAVRAQLPFLDGLETGRMVGNFKPPGLNVAGTLSYGEDQAAQKGAQNLSNLSQQLASWGWLMQLVGISQPVRRLEAQAAGKETQFVAELDGQGVAGLLDQAARLLPAALPSQPVPATTSPAVGSSPGSP
jgi:hypothetical protein